MASDDPLPGALKFAAEQTIARLPGFDTLWAIWGKLNGESLEADVDYLRIKLHALAARVKHLPERILTSPEFAKRAHQVFLALARTTQEEKRRHLCHALARYAAGEFPDEDEVTLLFPLVVALSLRHFIVLEDLLAHCNPPDSYLNPEELRLRATWERIKDRFPDGKDGPGKHVYEAVVADLTGSGLIRRTSTVVGLGEDPEVFPSYLAKRLLAFVNDPAPAAQV